MTEPISLPMASDTLRNEARMIREAADRTSGAMMACHDSVRLAHARIRELERWQREARAWLAACLGHVTGEGPPAWDGIRAFLADGEAGSGSEK